MVGDVLARGAFLLLHEASLRGETLFDDMLALGDQSVTLSPELLALSSQLAQIVLEPFALAAQAVQLYVARRGPRAASSSV